MDLSREILTAETRFLLKLEEFFIFAYSGENMESHGLQHHRRVWAYVKEFLCYPGTGFRTHSGLLTSKMIIAAYMHDIGMCIDQGPKHGIHSRNLCKNFLEQNQLPVKNFTDLLDAIEYHDDKEYATSRNNKLLQILSIADDLDALGYTGIYRYLKIYLVRKIKFEEVGDLIINNVRSRYTNMERSCSDKPGFLNRHQPRYEVILSFFKNYNEQKESYIFGTDSPSGYCGVAELISESVGKGTSVENLITTAAATGADEIVKQYFTNLRNELIKEQNGT
jgi:hypothetical protein